MTLSLAREEFLDRVWDPADLDAVAEFWMRLYESVSKAHRFAPVPEHQTEIRLRGFPRADADRLAGLVPRPCGRHRLRRAHGLSPRPGYVVASHQELRRPRRAAGGAGAAGSRGRGVRWSGDRDSLHGAGPRGARHEHARPWPARSGAVHSCSSPSGASGFRGGMMSRHSSLRGLPSQCSSQRSRNSA